MWNWLKRKSQEKSANHVLKALASLSNTVRGQPFASTPEMILAAQRNPLENLTVWSSLSLSDALSVCLEGLNEVAAPEDVYVATLRTFQEAAAVKGENIYEGFPPESVAKLKQLDARHVVD